ncbi:Metallophos domain-containing protein [Mycena kentingensis (nom. inval.)]|nr:Metallophos domain-containing protein [Mycena kentingensis (nom. inval.)]
MLAFDGGPTFVRPPSARPGSCAGADINSAPVADALAKRPAMSSIVQLAYEGRPTPKPHGNYTRFVLLSDTHSKTFPVPDGDVLLHSGDLTRLGTLRDLQQTMEWLYALPHAVKIIIAGNRDFSFDRAWYDQNWEATGRPAVWEPPGPIFELLKGRRARAANIVYLCDETHTFNAGGREWSIYGSPQTPNYRSRARAFGYDAPDAQRILSSFPATDILMTHGPPHGILDRTLTGGHAGCPALAERVSELRPRLHVFGHIHDARGAYAHDWEDTGTQTIFVNAANTPKVVEGGEELSVGGPGWQPVVVDLLN